MTTRVRLFVAMKDEHIARPLGLRRLRRHPVNGQQFQIPLDGRAVHARITRCAAPADPMAGRAITDVYAEEI
jgi:hypothetical protein